MALLRLEWEQQSKQAVISLQLQEVPGCESLSVCVCGCVLAPAVLPWSVPAPALATPTATAHRPTDKYSSSIVDKCAIHS